MSILRNKKYQVLFFIASATLYVTVSYIWINCVSFSCTEATIDKYLAPFKMTGLILVIYSGFLLLLPSKYFNAWFKYIFSWALPLSIILVAATRGTGDGFVISKTDVVRLMGMIFGVVTVFFIVVQRFMSKK